MIDGTSDRRRGLRGFVSGLPWWLGLLIGAALIVLGLWLMVRPLSSTTLLVLVIGVTLVVNGIGELLHTRAGLAGVLGALVLIAAGVLVLAFRGFTTSNLAVVIAVALIAVGVLRLYGASRPGATERATSVVLAAAAILAGAIALVWPDVTLLVAAVAFGGWTVLLGVQLAWNALASRRRGREGAAASEPGRGWFVRSARFVGALVVLAVVVLAGVVSIRLHGGVPQVDAFYATPGTVPSEPGTLLRAEPFTRGMPAGSEAWRILYTTTRADGAPGLASALVIAPRERPVGPLPLVAWMHGTTGFARECAPSLLPDPLTAGAMFTADQVVGRDWVLVATDYLGLGTEGPHPYLIGEGEGRSALDAIRAVRQLDGLTLSDRTVVWGHSQGGHAALWTGGLASTYAPELDIAGVAALAPASDLEGLVGNLGSAMTGGVLFAAYAFAAYDAAYDDVRERDYVDPSARTLLRALADRCLADPRTLVSVVEALAIANDRPVFSRSLTSGPMREHLRANTPALPIDAPLLIAQGQADPLVLPNVQRGYADARCAAGQALDYVAVPDRDHVALVEADSPLIPMLIAWTEARFAGTPVENGCDGP